MRGLGRPVPERLSDRWSRPVTVAKGVMAIAAAQGFGPCVEGMLSGNGGGFLLLGFKPRPPGRGACPPERLVVALAEVGANRLSRVGVGNRVNESN
ncbi:hypothetical protein NL676_035125 [Syzygium grande]|nr:hypothetical protein NL676_035125 [Syzygium grande]